MMLSHFYSKKKTYVESLCDLYLNGSLVKKAPIAVTNKTLKRAEPTMLPNPTSLNETKTPITLVMSPGKDKPTTTMMAPATS